MFNIDCRLILSTIDSEEKKLYGMFVKSMKKRIGSKNEISLNDIIEGFMSKKMTVNEDQLLKFWYNAIKLGHLKRIIYTGTTFFIGESDEEIHAFINQVWESAEECTDKKFGEILKTQARVLNKYIYEK